jgi:tetratricopeptide (TPR) repeat protein
MHGQTTRAVEQMCLSASWDLAGRGTYGLAEYYFQQADFEQALAWAERVPEGRKRHGDARTLLGDVYSQQGRVEEALSAYLAYWNMDADALDERADLAVRFVNSAAMARRKGDWWTAERFYRRALTLDSDQALAAAGLARVLAHFELHEATVYWAERALALNEKDATQAAMALCQTWLRKKNRAEAEKALDTLRRIAPSHPLVKSLARQIRRL